MISTCDGWGIPKCDCCVAGVLSYFELHNEPCSEETTRQIAVDVTRTLPLHCWFSRHPQRGRESLQRLLHALSVRLGADIGYVQGMNMIASLALIHMNDEERSFWFCVAYMEHYNMMHFYKNGLKFLQVCMDALDECIASHLPKLSLHLKSIGISSIMFSSPWFLTLFAYNLPFRQSTVIMDSFIVSGLKWKLVFMFAMEYLRHVQSKLLRSKVNYKTCDAAMISHYHLTYVCVVSIINLRCVISLRESHYYSLK